MLLLKALTYVNVIQSQHKKNPQGGITEKEAPIHVSNVMIIDPKTGKGTRIGKKIIIDDKTGKRKSVRISKSSGEMLG